MKSAVHAPFFEDFAAGETWRTYRRTVTDADLASFTQLAGLMLPIFVDHDWAEKNSPYGGPICPGFLICTFAAGMMESVLGANTLAGLGMDKFVFRTPVRPGDTLCCDVKVAEAKPASDGKRGILSLEIGVNNQRDERVLDFQAKVLMNRRGSILTR